MFCAVLGLFSVLGRFVRSSSGCCHRHNKWYQSIQVSLGISEDSESFRSDSVEIVCQSQIRGIGVRGIVCRSQEDARRAREICGEVDPETNSI